MKNLQEYTSKDGSHITKVDRQTNTVIIDEMGGWSRQYTLSFQELIGYAKDWDIPIKTTQKDEEIAEVAVQVLCANLAAKHGLNPFVYVPRSTKITHPKDKATIKAFEELLKNYSAEEILQNLSLQSKNIFLEGFDKLLNP